MPVITALLLDVDDTLIDTREAMVAAGEAAAAALWPQAGPAVHQAAGVRFHADPGGDFGRFTRGEISFAQMRQARVTELLEFFSLAPPDEVFRRFDDVYEPVFAASLRCFDDAVPFVEAVRAAGMPVGLLTNASSAYTSQKLEMTGLAGLFTVVATRDTLGFGKPDPRAFHHACGLLGSAPSETLYVGDHLEVDAIAARDAGLAAIWLLREPADPPDAARARTRGIPIVGSLSQVKGFL
jgi:putative hydrolase of the HAD superfamily